MMIAARNAFLMGGAKLPYDAEVEYVEVPDSICYIDTLVIPQDNSVIEFHCEPYYEPETAGTTTSARQFFGVTRKAVNTTKGPRSVSFKKSVTSGGPIWVAFSSGTFGSGLGNRSQISPNPTPEYVSDVVVYKNVLELNDVVYPFTTASELPLQLDQSLVLFAFKFGNEQLSNGFGPQGLKLTGFKITNGDTPVFDAIPVRVGTAGCLYDSVSKGLFYGQRGGDLIPGPDK